MKTILSIALYILWELIVIIRVYRWKHDLVQSRLSRVLFERYDDFNGEVTEKGLCSYIRHNYTNYE